MLLILGNVAKMLTVKSEGACSLTLDPGLAHLIFSGLLGQFHSELASDSPQGYFKTLSRKTL